MSDDKRLRKNSGLYKTSVDFETLLRDNNPQQAADILLEASYENIELTGKDVLDRFLEFVYFKAQTGYWADFNDAYPIKRMNDALLEEEISEMINVHLYPDITLKLLKFFTRNLYEPDNNLFIANLIYSKDIIRAIYEAFRTFRGAIFMSKEKRFMTVKSIQQLSINASEELSSPLEAASLFKYILEFLALKNNVADIYTNDDLRLSSQIPS